MPDATLDHPPARPAAAAGAVVARVTDLRVVRGGRDVLHGVSLDLRAGTTTLLIGPNGAGKTTLLRALSGGAVAGGSVTVAGRDPRTHPDARRQIGLVPQEVALYQRLTVAENVEVFADLAGCPRSRAGVAAVLDRMGLAAVAAQLVSTLSGGMQRRATVACALVCAPRLLLLDEPTAGLDLAARRALGGTLRRMAAETGTAVALTTHDLEESASLADRVLILHGGRLIAEGTPESVVAGVFRPAERQVDVVLVDPADGAATGTLERAGFVPLAGEVWRGILRADGEGRPPGAASLGLAEASIRELRVRRPALEDAFSVLTATVPAP